MMSLLFRELAAIPITETKRKPEYPFTTYQVLNYDTNYRYFGSIKQSDTGQTYTRQPQMIISIDVYSNDIIEALEKAQNAYDYFLFAGDGVLYAEDYSVAKIGDIEDRTSLIVDEYEYRYGFDVWVRTVKTIERKTEFIEEVIINE